MLLNVKKYHRPTALNEAVALLRLPATPAAVIAGGTELAGRTDSRLEAVVDLSRLGLAGITVSGGRITIGAMTTLKELETDPAIRGLAGGLLGRAAHLSAPATIRAAATLGGTLAGEKGGVEIPTVLLALDAKVTLATPGAVTLEIAEFLAQGRHLLTGAILTHVTIPVAEGARGGLARVSRSPADLSIAFAAAVLAGDEVRVALGGVSPCPRLLTDPANVPGEISAWDLMSDLRGSAEYRSWIAPVLVNRALEDATGGTLV